MKNKEIYMFPNAGGTRELFNGVCKKLREEYICFPFEYPGHGTDKSELLDTMDKLLESVYNFFKENHKDENEFVLMGYSMGSIVALNLLMNIEDNGHMPPIGVVLAANPPINHVFEDVCQSEEEVIKNFYMKNGEIPPELINSKLFKRIYMPSFRNDYKLLKQQNFLKLIERDHNCKGLIFYSEDDTPKKTVCGWGTCFLDGFKCVQYSGGHFFIRQHYEEIAHDILDYFR